MAAFMALQRIFTGRRWSAACLGLVLVAVAASRIAALPASIWDQDEALLAAAVIHFDPSLPQPHPPWFPLWIAIGRVAVWAGAEPARGLQLASLIFGTVMLLPLVALCSRTMKRSDAGLAALLFLAAPGPWLLAGRAYSGTAATALLLTALAFWIRTPRSRMATVAGSLAAGLAILVRPHLIVAVVPVVVWLAWHRRRDLAVLNLPCATVVAIGGLATVVAAGSPAVLLRALELHATHHFSALSLAHRSVLDSGLAHSLGHPAVTLAWLVLTAIGVARGLRDRGGREPTLAVLATLVPLTVLVFGLSDPSHPRYAVPILALSSGFVMTGLRTTFRSAAPLIAGAAVVAATALVWPGLATYRHEASPVVRALHEGDGVAFARRVPLVVDRRLVSFVRLLQAEGRLRSPVVFDHLLELGALDVPEPGAVVAVYDRGHRPDLTPVGRAVHFSCDWPLLRRLGPDRFLDVTVEAPRERSGLAEHLAEASLSGGIDADELDPDLPVTVDLALPLDPRIGADDLAADRDQEME